MGALILAVAPIAAAAAPGFLSEPAEGAPLVIALRYLDEHQDELGLTAADLADLVVRDEYATAHNGVSHIYVRQRLGGVEVVNGDININVMPDGRILSLGSRFVPDLMAKANTLAPAIQPEIALSSAARHLGVTPISSFEVLEVRGGPAMETVFSGAGLSRGPIPAKLMYLPVQGGGARLVWAMEIDQVGSVNYWNLFVDAVSGETLEKFNFTVSETFGPRGKNQTDSAADSPASPDGICTSNCYTVFALPKESPSDGSRSEEDNPADPTASPFGWHDTDGAVGAEFTDSRGNNVEAQTDLDANQVFTPGVDVRSEGGPSLIFNDPIDLAEQPSQYLEAAVTNLFYWNNIMHDVTYQYGFDEASGNFQQNNYGNGGVGTDPVFADAQDGSGTNNANFATFTDGLRGRMQMYVWEDIGPLVGARLTINQPGGIAGDYEASGGAWGGDLDPGTTGNFEIVSDGTASPTEGCSALVGFTPGRVALIDRGTCEFGAKALNAEDAGAVGVVIVNNQSLPNGIIRMGAGDDGDQVTIPAIMIGNADGQLIKDQLAVPNVVNGTLRCPIGGCSVPNPIDRDSDLDNGIIAHEYGHGISNRLVGGPTNVGCLSHPEQMGEGWSDWWALTLTPEATDTRDTARGMGSYVGFEGPDGPGIRNFPYSTEMTVNPQTYEDIGGTNVPHGVGEIWNAMLWEMYWNLVDDNGFDPDLYGGTGGNNLAIQLVVDGMKLAPCSPTFVDARDAILAADLANNAGVNQCRIWEAFAKRGVGMSSDAGTGAVGDETEAFDLPNGSNGLPDCRDIIFANGFEPGDEDWTLWFP